jgi:RsiW-degrading membrane proteinase PrsW (M82 family)
VALCSRGIASWAAGAHGDAPPKEDIAVSTGPEEGATQADATEPSTPGAASAPATRRHHRTKPRKPIRRTHTVLVLVLGFVVWLFIGLVPLHLLHNLAMAPAWFLIGAAFIPLTLFWIMAHRLTPRDTLTAEKLVQAAAIGGLLAFTLGGTLDSLGMLIPQEVAGGEGVTSLALSGVIEEFSKAVLVVALGWKVAKTTRNGLFLGGAIGIGFAILETTYYVWEAFGTGAPSPLVAAADVALRRGLFSPLMHPLWSALLGAAIFSAASKTGHYRLTLGVIGAYLGVAVLHGLWDASGSLVEIATGSAIAGGLATWGSMLVVGLVGGFVWRHVARRSRAALEAPAEAPASVPASGAPAAETPAAV